jgi:hypothetical protein
MTVERIHYEELLATYSQPVAVIELLKRYRPYLELLSSMRRPEESLITIPLPIIRLRQSMPASHGNGHITVTEPTLLPCDIALLLCDPEWKIKTGREIFLFIHRPDEDFSDLLGRWRQTQVLLGKEYEWMLPPRYQHFLNEGAEKVYPLFAVFENTPERILRGLKGSHLPAITHTIPSSSDTNSDAPGDEVDPWFDQLSSNQD